MPKFTGPKEMSGKTWSGPVKNFAVFGWTYREKYQNVSFGLVNRKLILPWLHKGVGFCTTISIISPLPAKPKGTLGFHSVRPSVRPSVSPPVRQSVRQSVSQSVSPTCFPHFFFETPRPNDLIFGMWTYIDELQIKFKFRSAWMIFVEVMALGNWKFCENISFPHFFLETLQANDLIFGM